MSDAILTFQVQLSAVMETVLKSAMYEITRLVEDSFLEEVARSKQEVEALRQRLQWWESRRRERESGGRARCVDCGRAGVSSQETEDPPSGTPSGAEGAPPLPLSKGCGEPEWSPAVRQDTAPSSDSLLAEQSSRAAAGESCGSYESQGQEGSARSLSLAGPQRCGRHWQRPAWTPFKLGDSDSEPDGLDPSYAAEPEPASPPAQREPQPRPAEEGAGHSASPLQYLNVKWEGGVADAPLVKEEAEMQPVCSEEMRWDAAHREPWDRGDLQMQVHQLSTTNARAKRRKSKDGQREFSNVARQVLTQFQVWQKACYSKNIDWNPVIAKIISTLPQLLGRETEVVDRCTKMLQNRREYLRRTGQVTRQNISGSPPPKSGPNHMLSSR
ncbi:hypothetical protein COCON_G00100570 [Conger conger]|uniref:Uncharacterized protein n=1 Tax=Conger conger TaxID=82655 RepID=A0A9Q1HYG6_CONCO|nr:uncharacterized protein LOC133131210 [Conger conger]KAJ8271198.1 hypothetical protein COCON_G00100570 [Conger conger]